MDLPDFVIEYSIDSGVTWTHSRTVPRWVHDDPAALAVQRKVVRDQARLNHNLVGVPGIRVTTRVLAEDDPRAELNRLVDHDQK